MLRAITFAQRYASMNRRLLFIQIATGMAIGIAVFFADVYSTFFASAHLPDTVLAPLLAGSFLAAVAISVFGVALRTQHFTHWSDRHLGSSAAWSYVARQTLIGVCVIGSTATFAWAITFSRLVAP